MLYSEAPTDINYPSTLYAGGCLPMVDSDGTLTVTSGWVRDSSNVYDMSKSTTTLLSASTGVNGLDITQTITGSTLYSIFEMWDSTNSLPVAYNISGRSALAPNYPIVNGIAYNVSRLVGYVLTKSTIENISKAFVPMVTYGTGTGREVRFQPYSLYDLTAVTMVSSQSYGTSTFVPSGGRLPPITNNNIYLNILSAATGSGNSFTLQYPFFKHYSGNTSSPMGIYQPLSAISVFSGGSYGFFWTTVSGNLTVYLDGFDFTLS